MIRNDLQSRTIDALRLVLIICVVLVHAYTATRSDIDSSQFPLYRFVSFLISLNIAQVAIPGFFFISGYLHFNSTSTYTRHLKSDWRHLIRPYILWNAIIISLYWMAESVPALTGYFSGENLRVHDYGFTDLLRAFWDGGNWDHGNGTPALHQFWYIRNLFLLTLIAPIIRLFVKWTGITGIALLALWWIFTPGQAMIAKSVAFYAFGAWYGVRKHDFLPPFRKWSYAIGACYILLVTITMVFWQYPWSVWVNRTGCILGLITFTNLTSLFVQRDRKHRPLGYLQGLTFFIYAAHDPLIVFVKRLALRITPMTDTALTIAYFAVPILVIAFCTVAYILIKRIAPHLMSILVGARSRKTHYAQ